MKALIFFAFLAVLAVPAQARIGETEFQLITRFGPPISRGFDLGPTLTFAFGEWTVVCDIVDGMCARIRYSKIGDWTEENFETLLKANGHRSGWNDLVSPNMKKLMRKWKRGDGTLAQWVVGCLSITSPRYEKARAMADAEAVMAATNI